MAKSFQKFHLDRLKSKLSGDKVSLTAAECDYFKHLIEKETAFLEELKEKSDSITSLKKTINFFESKVTNYQAEELRVGKQLNEASIIAQDRAFQIKKDKVIIEYLEKRLK